MGDDFYDPMNYDIGYPSNGGGFDDFTGSYSTGGDATGGADLGAFAALGGLLPTAIPRIAGGVAGNPGRIMRSGGIAGSIIAAGTGARLSMRKVWELTKRFGPEMAAGAVGWAVPDLLQALLASGALTRRRRRRGISSRDIRTTKRVCRFAHSLNATLSHCGTRRRRSC